MPQVSIITGTYNQASYISQAIESVLHQTFRDYEHIVVDDGSGDNTREVIAPYMSRITYEYQENKGNAASRNKGYEIASGDLIAILDGDDFWGPTKLEKQVAIMNRCPNVGLVYTGMQEVNEQGEIISPVKAKDISDDALRHQLLGNATPFSSMLIRRSVLEKGVLIAARFNLVGDRFLTLQVALQGKRFVCLPEGLLFLRTHNSSMRYSAAFRNNYLNQMLLLIREVQSDPRLPQGYAHILKQAQARAYLTSAWLMIDRGDCDERNEAHKLLCKSLVNDWRLVLPVIKQFIKSYVRFSIKKKGPQS